MIICLSMGSDRSWSSKRISIIKEILIAILLIIPILALLPPWLQYIETRSGFLEEFNLLLLLSILLIMVPSTYYILLIQSPAKKPALSFKANLFIATFIAIAVTFMAYMIALYWRTKGLPYDFYDLLLVAPLIFLIIPFVVFFSLKTFEPKSKKATKFGYLAIFITYLIALIVYMILLVSWIYLANEPNPYSYRFALLFQFYFVIPIHSIAILAFTLVSGISGIGWKILSIRTTLSLVFMIFSIKALFFIVPQTWGA